MLGRLVKDESGIAMGLAVIVVLLVGVMGAGLLVFVRNDLEAVVEVNQGQQAFDAADAGVQAAKRELLSDACPESYDGSVAGASNEEDACADASESDWSYEDVEDENAGAGKELEFDGQQVEVEIRWLDPNNNDQLGAGGEIPEGRDYFEIESAGNSENGDARRKVEAIYYTLDLGYPRAYYSQETVKLRGGPCIEEISVFSLDSIDISGGGSGCDEGGNITGPDLAYGDWKNDFNNTARSGQMCTGELSDGTEVEKMCAGFGAVEDVDVDEDGKLGTRDFDSSDDSNPYEFIADTDETDPGDTPITFPFDHEAQAGEADEDRLELLKEKAQEQGNYRSDSSDITDWPNNTDDRTVVYIETSGGGDGKIKWQVGGSCSEEDALKGTLVVDGATLEVSGSKKLFSGVTIVRGGQFASKGNPCWGGPVNADGSIEIRGNASSVASESVLDRPGFYGVEQWSWRECYSEDCN